MVGFRGGSHRQYAAQLMAVGGGAASLSQLRLVDNKLRDCHNIVNCCRETLKPINSKLRQGMPDYPGYFHLNLVKQCISHIAQTPNILTTTQRHATHRTPAADMTSVV